MFRRGTSRYSLQQYLRREPEISWSYFYQTAAPVDKLAYSPLTTAYQTTSVVGRGDTVDSDCECLVLFPQTLWGYLKTEK